MGTWGIVIVVVAVVLVVSALVTLRGGKEGRAARRDLRRLRSAEKRDPNTAGAAELRHNMQMNQVPGKTTHPGGP
jgi:hypothetical protein